MSIEEYYSHLNNSFIEFLRHKNYFFDIEKPFHTFHSSDMTNSIFLSIYKIVRNGKVIYSKNVNKLIEFMTNHSLINVLNLFAASNGKIVEKNESNQNEINGQNLIDGKSNENNENQIPNQTIQINSNQQNCLCIQNHQFTQFNQMNGMTNDTNEITKREFYIKLDLENMQQLIIFASSSEENPKDIEKKYGKQFGEKGVKLFKKKGFTECQKKQIQVIKDMFKRIQFEELCRLIVAKISITNVNEKY